MKKSPPEHGRTRWWRVAFLALLCWQGWLTLGLFGPDPWQQLTSDAPVISGRHPLHLYHGFLGARSWLDRGSLSCYDPAFHAGYPKTPVFDSGSRPAELILALVGGRFCPSSYKIGIGVLCLSVPFAVYLAARGLGLARATGVLAVLLSQLVWWGRPGREALEAGDCDLLLGSLAGLVQCGLLVRYHHKPGTLNLAGVILSGLVGWFAHPLLMVLLLPPTLIYYLAVGPSHGVLWHLPLFGSLGVSLAANAFWLTDLVGFWWVRVVPELDTPLVTRLTVGGVWRSDLWGDAFDRGVCIVLLALCLAGLAVMFASGRRVAARMVGVSTGMLFTLAVVGLLHDQAGRMGTAQLVVPALLMTCLPVACLAAAGLHRLRRGHALAPLVVILVILLTAWVFVPTVQRERAAQLLMTRQLHIGLGPAREALVKAVREATTGEARILWEDRPNSRLESRWAALLPILTERSFVGGLDAGAGIEHTATGLVEGRLSGQILSEWSDEKLEEYCQRYNICWIATRTAGAKARLQRWSLATGRDLPGDMRLFTVHRRPSFAISGSVTLSAADSRGILLADARPILEKDGKGTIELCFHYQAGMRVSPSRIQIEEKRTTEDTIPFIRLRLNEPAGRILITWEGR